MPFRWKCLRRSRWLDWPPGFRCREPFADLNALDRVDAHTGRRQLGIKLGINWCAPACRNTGSNAFDDRPETVAAGSRLVEHGFPAALVALAANLDHAGGNVNFRDHQARHCTAGDARGRFAGRSPAAATRIAKAIFGVVGRVGVAWPVRRIRRIIRRTRIDIFDHHRNRRAGRLAPIDA